MGALRASAPLCPLTEWPETCSLTCCCRLEGGPSLQLDLMLTGWLGGFVPDARAGALGDRAGLGAAISHWAPLP